MLKFCKVVAGVGLAVALASGSSVRAATGTFIDRANASDLRIATFNVFNDSIFNDFAAPTVGSRKQRFMRMALKLNPDIWCFQEMYNQSTASVKTLMDAAQPLGTPNGWYIYQPTFDEHVIASKYPISLGRNNTTPAGYRAVAMGLVDLPAQFSHDLYLMNAHYRCCGDTLNDPERQKQSDAFVNWMRDLRNAGGNLTLTAGTAMMVLGDINLVGGPQPLTTLLNGDIQNELTYGIDSLPDWDGTTNSVVNAFHNLSGTENYTWRDDLQQFAPGRLDYMTYTDSVMTLRKAFVLNTMSMSPADLAASGLQQYDSVYNVQTYDHLPVFADFTMVPEPGGAVVVGVAAIAVMGRRRARE
jgi:endonuclease/exonuclease/phosphatase family metal-dependent hydrolase